MKWLVLEKLAPRLCFTVSAESPTPYVACNTEDNNDAIDFQKDEQQLQEMTFATTNRLLTEIRDLLQVKIRSKAEDVSKSAEDNKTKNDWKLAAAVIDRILLIIFSILVVGGSAIFLITFAVMYHLKNEHILAVITRRPDGVS